MHIDPAKTSSHEASVVNETEHFLMVGDRSLRQRPQQRKGFKSVLKMTTGQLTDDKGVRENDAALQKLAEGRRSAAKVGHPDGRVDQDHSGALKAPPRDRAQARFRSTECRQPPAALLGDQCLKPPMDQGGFLSYAGEGSRFLQHRLIQVQSRSHMYEYAS